MSGSLHSLWIKICVGSLALAPRPTILKLCMAYGFWMQSCCSSHTNPWRCSSMHTIIERKCQRYAEGLSETSEKVLNKFMKILSTELGSPLDSDWTRRLALHGSLPTLQWHVDSLLALRSPPQGPADTFAKWIYKPFNAVSWWVWCFLFFFFTFFCVYFEANRVIREIDTCICVCKFDKSSLYLHSTLFYNRKLTSFYGTTVLLLDISSFIWAEKE